MTLAEIAASRFNNQQLSGTNILSAAEMVEWFGAIQGQEYAQTKWGIGLRMPHLADQDIEDELTRGSILRTHLLRPTWHFVSEKDICWLLALTAPRVHAANAFMYRKMELNNRIFSRCIDILAKILGGGKELSRDEINKEFEKNQVLAKGHRLSYIMMYAELEGIICSGARQGNQFTYALLEERIAPDRSVKQDEALAELTTRYFKSRGPATAKDFATWSGLTIADCKKGLEMVNSILHSGMAETQGYFYIPNTQPSASQPEHLHLLPVYDEFIMGYKDRSAIMLAKGKAAFRYDSMILSGGQVIGTWKRTIAKNTILLEYEFFKPPDKDRLSAFMRCVKRLSEFSGMEVKTIPAIT